MTVPAAGMMIEIRQVARTVVRADFGETGCSGILRVQRTNAGCWVLGAGCWVLGAGCWVLGAGCWVLGAGFSVLGAGCWVAGCWVLGAALLGAGCGVRGAGCAVLEVKVLNIEFSLCSPNVSGDGRATISQPSGTVSASIHTAASLCWPDFPRLRSVPYVRRSMFAAEI